MIQKPDKLLLIALFIGLVFHGTIFYFTFDATYDAFVHIFFADHYARSWFEPWDNRWYTGFNVTSYPPLVHQLTALLSYFIGLRNAFVLLATGIMLLFIVGAYRFAKLWTTGRSAGYAAIFACFCSSIVEALHLFGQLPTLMGISCLLNALPEIYRWIRYKKTYRLMTSLSIMGVGVTSHHVTTIFGMVFFVAPVMGLAVMDVIIERKLGKKYDNSDSEIRTLVEIKALKITIRDFLNETIATWKQLVLFVGAVPLLMMLVFPYFYWSKTDPITQVSIPHGSRDSFFEVPSSGQMFFLIPMGIILVILPYIFFRVWTKRNLFIGLSFSLVLLFGTGGTTPLPKLMLGENAFNILTLDRFTFWATMISIPFVGEFFYRLMEGDIRDYLREKIGKWPHRIIWSGLATFLAFLTIFIINLGRFRPLQPATIDTTAIVQFLERDQHDKWRFMTLGFGDQMAWLSAQTKAQSVDGNYHSARRLPEMTTRPLERLENSKFKGIEGLGSLQQFLTVPEKYYLKFVFSNDKFYDPILYFSGWERVQRLENGIMVWQKQDVPPLPSVLPDKELPRLIKLWWGIMPLFALLAAFCINFVFLWYSRVSEKEFFKDNYRSPEMLIAELKPRSLIGYGLWGIFVIVAFVYIWVTSAFKPDQNTPEQVLESYYNALDFKYFKTAYGYFNPETRPDFDDYYIKLSVEDGIVASYAKLDNLDIALSKIDDNTYDALVHTDWITPVEEYRTDYHHRVRKVNGKWFIDPPQYDVYIPPDTFVDEAFLSMHSQGKRQAGTDPTEHDDVMDRPNIRILNAKLVQTDSSYSVVGELINEDRLPAHITVQANLYDKYDRKLVSYNAKYTTIHRILPKEKTAFRIDFESTAWVNKEDLDPGNFDPNEESAFVFDIPPASFKLMARAVVDKNDIYRSVGFQNIKVNAEKIQGEVTNYGTDEVSVPKGLISYFDKAGDLKWVESFFVREGVRQQRKRSFNHFFTPLDKLQVIYVGENEDFYCNGLLNKDAGQRSNDIKRLGAIETPYGFVQLKIDPYIGSPTIY
ncbi:MAG: hypothetical protein NXI00_17190 [Cytophagales bacterium]|nr:hypothetical protein [Cytophagales bacterium]